MISDLYATNRIFANIVDLPAEDATREWIRFEGIDDTLSEQLTNKLSNLSAQQMFQKALAFERLRGDGFISIGAKHSGTFDVGDPIKRASLKDIEYLHAFSGMKLVDLIENDDVFSPSYGNIELYEFSSSGRNRLVHSDRVLHLSTRRIEDEDRGIPLIQMLYDALLVFDNALWSTGQLMYSMVLKRLKTDGIDISDNERRRSMQSELEYEFNTNTLAVIGTEDDLDFISPEVKLPLKDMYTFLWEMLATISRMPKSHIMGQSQGEVTGGKYDSLNYYMRIAGIQEAHMRMPLENLVDLSLLASDSGVGSGSLDPDDVLYQMKFNPLWKLDDKTDADIRKINAEIDNIYLNHAVISPGQVREQRFDDSKSLLSRLDMDEAELERIAKEIKAAHEEADKNG